MQACLVFLIGYHFLFFRKFYENPYIFCTSEMASTYFPHFVWMGRQLRRRRFPLTDRIYFRYPACIPFLSTFYPFKWVLSRICASLNLNAKFCIFAYSLLLHYLLGSIISFMMFKQWYSDLVALFGALTLTYAGYCVKLQTPAFVYTSCWIPGIFIRGFFSIIALGMTILGGYWPILVYVLPLLILNPGAIIGLIVGLLQIIPFIWYWGKSVRAGKRGNFEVGRLPWWKLKDLFIPSNSVKPTNGVHYPEVAMYMGISIFFIWHLSLWWIPSIFALSVLIGVLPAVQRIPARVLYLLTFCLSMASAEAIASYHSRFDLTILLLIQAAMLLRNSSIYPSFPFSQWWDKPNHLYNRLHSDSWPMFSGYLTETKTPGYRGSFALKGGTWNANT